MVEKGDMVCVYTGFADVLLEMKKKPDAEARQRDLHRPQRPRREAAAVDHRLGPRLHHCRQLRGRADPDQPHRSAAEASSRGCRCTSTACSRTASTSARCSTLTELARWLREHKRSRFLLTAPPLRLPGAVGSPSTADRHGMKVAIVTGGTSGMGEATAQGAGEARLAGRRHGAQQGRRRNSVGRRRRRTPIAAASPRRCSTSGAASTRW